MASDGETVQITSAALVQASQVPLVAPVKALSGKTLPPSGNGNPKSVPAVNEPAPAAKPAPTPAGGDVASQVAVLNKYLNDSGRPDQFRASADLKSIQEINPATGAVIAEYPSIVFPALARSVGVSGALVDKLA